MSKRTPTRSSHPKPAAPAPHETARKSFWHRLGDVFDEMTIEAVATGLTILLIYGVHRLVKWLFGEGAKFFDLIPIAWVFDAGHIALIGRLTWRAVRKYNG